MIEIGVDEHMSAADLLGLVAAHHRDRARFAIEEATTLEAQVAKSSARAAELRAKGELLQERARDLIAAVKQLERDPDMAAFEKHYGASK